MTAPNINDRIMQLKASLSGSDTITQQANAIADQLQSDFNTQSNNAGQATSIYNSLVINSGYMSELNNEYVNENTTISTNLSTLQSDYITNDRKAFYEIQGQSTIETLYTILIYIYIALGVVISLGLIFRTTYSWYVKIFIILVLIVYPFLMNYLTPYIISGFAQLIALFPKNVYVDMEPTK